MSDKHKLSEVRRTIKTMQMVCRNEAGKIIENTGVPAETIANMPFEQRFNVLKGLSREDTHDAICCINGDIAISEGRVFLVPLDEVLSAATNFGNLTKIALEERAIFVANDYKFLVNLPYERNFFVLYKYDEQKVAKAFACCAACQLADRKDGKPITVMYWISIKDDELLAEIGKIKDIIIRSQILSFLLRTITAMISKGGFHKTVDSVPGKLKKKRELKANKTGRESPYSGDITYLTSRSEGGGGSGTRNGGTVAAHWVRGHLKRCKTGIYWWNAHIAGSGEVKKRTAYKL